MSAKPNPWLEKADILTQGAENARVAGDLVAMAELLVLASQCIQIAKNLERADRLLASPSNTGER